MIRVSILFSSFTPHCFDEKSENKNILSLQHPKSNWQENTKFHSTAFEIDLHCSMFFSFHKFCKIIKLWTQAKHPLNQLLSGFWMGFKKDHFDVKQRQDSMIKKFFKIHSRVRISMKMYIFLTIYLFFCTDLFAFGIIFKDLVFRYKHRDSSQIWAP